MIKHCVECNASICITLCWLIFSVISAVFATFIYNYACDRQYFHITSKFY